jgi:type II secretory pathway pseudopilin PulG
MKRRLADESGITMVELVVVMLVLGIVVAALADAFSAGLRASSDSSARSNAQENVRTAMDRIEFEARCASGATVGGAGANVLLTLPSECDHATGSYTWCVSGGQLIRYAATTCTGTGTVFADGVTSATPFTLLTSSGLLPRLQVSIAVDAQSTTADQVSITDVVTMRNAARTA